MTQDTRQADAETPLARELLRAALGLAAGFRASLAKAGGGALKPLSEDLRRKQLGLEAKCPHDAARRRSAARCWQTATAQGRGSYLRAVLGDHSHRAVKGGDAKLCPAPSRDGKIGTLTELQRLAGKLIHPDSPLRRLVLVLSPGVGKTCLYLHICAPFIGKDYSIVYVADRDSRTALLKDLWKCPSLVEGDLVDDKSKSVLLYRGFLRDVNAAQGNFCALHGQAKAETQETPQDWKCAPALRWKQGSFYVFDFVRAGNWLRSALESRKAGGKYAVLDPFSPKLLLVIDEAHKLGMPSGEQTTGSHKAEAADFGRLLATLGEDVERTPRIVAGTATPNTTQHPALSLCLPRLVKGRTESRLFEDGGAGARPRLDLRRYLDPGSGFVTLAQQLRLVAAAPPGVHAEPAVVEMAALQRRFREHRAFPAPPTTKAAAGDADDERQHPCPVSEQELLEASWNVYRPVDTEANRREIQALWADVAVVVDSTDDVRYYPVKQLPYPQLRPVALAEQERYFELLRKEEERRRGYWSERSQFADPDVLKELVEAFCASGELPPDFVEVVERQAPKWSAVAEDLVGGRLLGRSFVYVGARYHKDCDDNYYLVALALYLRAKLAPELQKHGAAAHRLATLDALLGAPSEPQGGPAIYIYADPSKTAKYTQDRFTEALAALDADLKAGRRPAAREVFAKLGEEAFCRQQLEAFNAEACPGAAALRVAGAHSLVVLAEGAHKAIDLACVRNGLVLAPMPGGKFVQTQGRARRSCAFKALPQEPALWRTEMLVYLLWSADALHAGPNLDQALHGFYAAQYEAVRYLDMLAASAGIGCSNWAVYSRWQEKFKGFDALPLGGFRCADAEVQSAAGEFFFYDRAAATIRRGVAGDLSEDAVRRSCCSKEEGHLRADAALPAGPRSAAAASDAARRKLQAALALIEGRPLPLKRHDPPPGAEEDRALRKRPKAAAPRQEADDDPPGAEEAPAPQKRPTAAAPKPGGEPSGRSSPLEVRGAKAPPQRPARLVRASPQEDAQREGILARLRALAAGAVRMLPNAMPRGSFSEP